MLQLRFHRLAAEVRMWWAKHIFLSWRRKKLKLQWGDFVRNRSTGSVCDRKCTIADGDESRWPNDETIGWRRAKPSTSRRISSSDEVRRKMQRGAERWRQRNVTVDIINLMRSAVQSQWWLASVVLMRAEHGRPAMILAAALSTDCRRRRIYVGMPVKVMFPQSNVSKTSDTTSFLSLMVAATRPVRTHRIWRIAAKQPGVSWMLFKRSASM